MEEHIITAIWKGDIEILKYFADTYQFKNDVNIFNDKGWANPVLHESAHQAGNDPYREGISEEQKKRFIKQNEVFKYLWSHPKFKKLIHNEKYLDKYKLTPIERLMNMYPTYEENLKIWIKNNVFSDIDKIETCKGDFPYEFPCIIKNPELLDSLKN